MLYSVFLLTLKKGLILNSINYNPEKTSIALQQEDGQTFSEKRCKNAPQSKISSLGSQILENNPFQQNQQLSPAPQSLLTPSIIKAYKIAMLRQTNLEKAITKSLEINEALSHIDYGGLPPERARVKLPEMLEKQQAALVEADKALARARGIIYKPNDLFLWLNWDPKYGTPLPEEKQIPFKLTQRAMCLIEAIAMGEVPPSKYDPEIGDFHEYCNHATPPLRDEY